MRYASVLFHQQQRDEMFSPGPGANGGGLYFPFRRLREVFLENGVQLCTPDRNVGRPVAFELHINARKRLPDVPCYAYLWEHPVIRPINGNHAQLARYRQCFTWNTSLVDGRRIHDVAIPNNLRQQPSPGFAERDLFCVVIAGNRALRSPHPADLHGARLRLMRWFEQHAPEDFALYGPGWDRPTKKASVFSRMMSRIYTWPGMQRHRGEFSTWKGPVESKDQVLRRAKFSLCYENLRGGPGYITEKLWDCWLYGCVPVYVGASDIAQRVPTDCFISGDAYTEPQALHDALKRISADEFAWRRERVAAFLRSPQAQPYDDEHFCRSLQRHISRDMG